jgi:AcrR family transcriptional regulator
MVLLKDQEANNDFTYWTGQINCSVRLSPLTLCRLPAKLAHMTDPKYWQILDCAVKLEVSKGHLRWTISDLSRGSGVGRTLIYYYFGKAKAEIVKVALKIVSDEIFGLSPERLKLWEAGDIKSSILKSREMIEKAPHLREFYFHWRHTQSEIRDHLISVEKRYLQKIKKSRPSLDDKSAHALFTVLFGLVMMPDLKLESIEIVLSRLGQT